MKWSHILLMVFCAASVAGADRMQYDMKVQLRPEQAALQVTGTVSFPVPKDDIREVTFFLNRGLEVSSVSCSECAEHLFEPSKFRVYMYAPDASPLTIRFRRPLRKGHAVRIRFAYGGKPLPGQYSTGSAGPDWVELALYNAWFPMQRELGPFTYDVSIEVDPAWQVSGAGRLTGTGAGRYRLRQQVETVDINVVASRHFKTLSLEDSSLPLRIDYVGLEQDAVERMGRTSAAIAGQFTAWLGRKVSGGLTIVFADRSHGGYSRPAFICYGRAYMSGLPETEVSAFLAHEIAHIWWMGAPVESWEDWLNESFAEYSAMMFIRQFHGRQAFENRLAEFRKATAGTPAICGMDRTSPKAYETLYKKGPLILYELEKMIGQDLFHDFLAVLIRERIHSTGGLLAALEQISTPAVRQRFELMLASSGPPAPPEPQP